MKDNLPRHAQTIYRAAFNDAVEQYKSPKERRDDASREETAHYLSENFELDDPEALLDEVYARVSS